MNLQEQILTEMLESQAHFNYYLQWNDEPICGKPAFHIHAPYSAMAQNRHWTLFMSLIMVKEFRSFKKAEEHLKEFFLKANERHGKLYKQTDGGLKVIAQK